MIDAPNWSSWREVPRNAREVAQYGPFFVELFSGTARLTQCVRALGVPCLPPIDIMPSPFVSDPQDVVDLEFWEFFMELVWLGAVVFAHFGTPCNTFSSARKNDGGPPPLRSSEFPDGLPSIPVAYAASLFMGNLFLDRTLEAAEAIVMLGGDFSLENPLQSLLWETQRSRSLQRQARAHFVDLDQCMFGAPSPKPTRLMVTHYAFDALTIRCSGDHKHVKLKGRVWSDQFQAVVFRTKLAQEYPWSLCEAMALAIQRAMSRSLEALQPSFALLHPANESRKRPLGQEVKHREHRQQATARLAQSSGYQLKRGALKPLVDIETEPGVAIEWSLQIPHPFSMVETLEGEVVTAIRQVSSDPAGVVAHRQHLLQRWESIAVQLLPETDQCLRGVSDPWLRQLLRGVPDDQPVALGSCCHVLLYRMMLQEVGSVDVTLADRLVEGFSIVGPIDRSGRWADYTKPQPAIPVQDALDRAWAIRKKIINRAKSVPCSENLKKLWDATLEDVKEGSSVGPWFSEGEVTTFVGSNDWIPTQRFEVVQKNKVRGCDSATTNLINQITVITEKLQLPSTDSNVAALRALRSEAPLRKIAGWVLDERKAYRQVPIRPDQRKFSIIALKDPCSGRVGFFGMIGHSFGLVSAVYNYNRRSAAINEILVKLFGLVAFSFYDDKYGFEPIESASSAHQVAQCVHWWLGAKFDSKKLQLSRAPTILGVTYNLEFMRLEIKEDRKKELCEEIDAILKCGLLDPGSAGKLKGKLMFGASQLWGKVGRAFLRVISERQYLRFPSKSEFVVDEPLIRALCHWRNLVMEGPPRPIEVRFRKTSDVVIFTDGFTPDPRSQDKSPDRVGAVLFDRKLDQPLQFTAVVPREVSEKWLVRKTQIVPIEMLAPILAFESFADRLFGADLILLIDSEAVEGALVKGYSSREDISSLISVFWNLALKLGCRVFIDRIATDANPADWPSRGNLSIGRSAGWLTVQAQWPEGLISDR